MGDGKLLEQYVRARWGRDRGGIRGLTRVLGVAPQTLYGYFNGDHPVDLDFLATLAAALGVNRYEIVAAMDGAGTVTPLDAETRELIREEVRAALAEAQAPRRAQREA